MDGDRMPDLRELNLENCLSLTDEGIESINSVSSLERLNIVGTTREGKKCEVRNTGKKTRRKENKEKRRVHFSSVVFIFLFPVFLLNVHLSGSDVIYLLPLIFPF